MTPSWLIIHHTATDRDTTTFSGVKNYHISKGWGDIGYHWFITTNRVYKGRAENVVGAHCRADGMNFKSLGICVAGNFMKEDPVGWQINRLNKLVKELQNKYNIPKSNILGHREVNGASTACPGNNLMPHIVEMRGGEGMQYKGLDLSNKDSMKAAVDIWHAVMKENKYITQEKYAALEKTTKTRIDKEKDRYKNFIFEIHKLLPDVSKEEPEILEAIKGLTVQEDTNESGEVEVPGHSRICRLLAKLKL